MIDEIWIRTIRLIAEGIEGCKYNTLDCRLPDPYSHTRSPARQTTEAQSVSVTHKRWARAEAASQTPGTRVSVVCSQS